MPKTFDGFLLKMQNTGVASTFLVEISRVFSTSTVHADVSLHHLKLREQLVCIRVVFDFIQRET
jgi:hypothetical protein